MITSSDFIPLCEPNIAGAEWQYVKECLDSGWVSSGGSFVDRFERQFAEVLGARHAIAVVNGTAALHLALLTADIVADDEVLMPSLTFIAPANAVRYTGAWPTFLDVDPDFGQLDPARLKVYLRDECVRQGGVIVNRVTKRRVRAILPVHVLGHPSDLDALSEVAREFDLAFIEDATESLGARYRGRNLGQHSRVAAFSFNGNKLLTTGGGGMLVTNDDLVARQVKYLSTQAKDDPTEFVHRSVGYNYRLTSVQAAIGCAQLERLAEFVEIKRRIAQRYDTALSQVPGLAPVREAEWARSSCWLSTIRVDAEKFGCTSRALMHALAKEGIQTRPLWQTLHSSPAHVLSHHVACPEAERWVSEGLNLPCSTHLSDTQQHRVITAIQRIEIAQHASAWSAP